ncbi:MAG: radical SAM protein [Bacteroidales bacterium]|nr:radical SAM protein [Bacteroidales bacterium]
MKWSRYNFLFKSERYGLFIYNSVTNAFLKLNDELYQICKKIELDASNISLLDDEIKDGFIQSKILTTAFEENNYITQATYLKRLRSFDYRTLGLVIAPTYTCNFACPYCYEHNMPDYHMSEQTEDQIISFIKTFHQVEDVQICWHGGEPLLRFNNIKSLITKIRSTKEIKLAKHHIVTNGYLLDEEKCAFFKEVGLDSVQITIDGLEATHNINRKHKSGKPTFDTIIKNIDHLLNSYSECKVNLRVNIHDGNKDEYPELRRQILEKWVDKNIYLYFSYVQNHGQCQVACLENKNKLQFSVDLYKNHGINEVELYPTSKLGGCTADANQSYIIGPKGELYKCWVDLGKKDKEIGHIADTKLNLSLISEYVVGTDKYSDAKCIDCFLFPVCDGGCGLYRFDYKKYGKDYNVCPINPEDLNLLLELFYEKQIQK